LALGAAPGSAALEAHADALRGPGGPLPVSLMRAALIHLDKPSGPEGRAGDWPDALIPARDALFGEERRAFPVDVAKDRAQAIFVEVCAPARAHPGRYSGAVRLSWKGGAAEVPVHARVRGFD